MSIAKQLKITTFEATFMNIPMQAVYLDTHIHTSDNPESLNLEYDVELLHTALQSAAQEGPYLASLTDHNTINTLAYLKAIEIGMNLIVGVELHIKNFDTKPAYHCHIYFNIDKIEKETLNDLNKVLDQLYPHKTVEKMDINLPRLQDIVNAFEGYDFMLLPHGGQSHATFNTSIPSDANIDNTLSRNIYYNHFEGFTARGNTRLERTQAYFKKLGISSFVNLITCSDNYSPNTYPKGKDKNPFIPTWMLATPTFDGLRISLSESSRLHYSHRRPDHWAECIGKVNLVNERLDIDISLTSGLNVVIGSSSSGKTLLVDSIIRKLSDNTTDSTYKEFGIDQINIDNPSGMVPHYISQNYIVSVVNSIEGRELNSIDVMKHVFPDNIEIETSTQNAIHQIEKNVSLLVDSASKIATIGSKLSKIPALARLVSIQRAAGNCFAQLMPSATELENISVDRPQIDTMILNIRAAAKLIKRYPFVSNTTGEANLLISKLEEIRKISVLEESARSKIINYKENTDTKLRISDTETQTKQQNFDRLLELSKEYMVAHTEFKRAIQYMKSTQVSYTTTKIESNGHTLSIAHKFNFNDKSFIESLNTLIKNKVPSLSALQPRHLFSENHRKKSPKVSDYNDLKWHIIEYFKNLNKREYSITTKDGYEFNKLSPGWKTSIILDVILGYTGDISPIIIDQPEDNLANDYINKGLLDSILRAKKQKQIILVSHNATIPMLADAQNIIFCNNTDDQIIIRSAPLEGKIGDHQVLDYIANVTDGGKASIKKRVKKYNLKNFKNEN